MSDRRPLLARWRVPLGFVTAIGVIMYSTPTWRTLWIGFAVAVVGEAIRVWAAGHLEKSREVTRSGPYRFTRHPLYLGSSFIAVGVMLAANSLVVAIAGTVYMVATIGAAILTEEAFLRQAFGDTYARYRAVRGGADAPAVQHRAGDAQSRVSRGGRADGRVCAPCLESCGVGIIRTLCEAAPARP